MRTRSVWLCTGISNKHAGLVHAPTGPDAQTAGVSRPSLGRHASWRGVEWPSPKRDRRRYRLGAPRRERRSAAFGRLTGIVAGNGSRYRRPDTPSPARARKPMPGAPPSIASIADVRRLSALPYERFMPHRRILEALQDVAARQPQRIALTGIELPDPDAAVRRWTYAQLVADVRRTANLFHALADGAPARVHALLQELTDVDPLAERVVEEDAPALLGEERHEVLHELGHAARVSRAGELFLRRHREDRRV
ncbi:MAG TPA: hypothetical protein PKD25_13950, partial [Rubrivivax sp.]|nr:hypothetical protein [Rubrivivax sp.]